MDVVRPAADAKGVQLIADIATDLPAVSGDRDRVLQIIWNLLSNAVKFTDSGGRVTVSTAAADGFVRLAVADTGHGIAPEFRAHVFERFKQADSSSARRHGGLGLGLALVRELVELHGGTVGVASDGVGRGSTFTVVLPARSGQSPRSELAPPPTAATPSLEELPLLVVEDDADAREIIMRALTAAGASVTSASSAAEAIDVLRRNPNGFRAVVTDIGMPDGDGFALLREMRKLPPAAGGMLPAIAVSAYASAGDRSRALQAGFAAHISKPYTLDALIAAIGRAVGSAVE
jgi:CheY-like chemotaxis protein